MRLASISGLPARTRLFHTLVLAGAALVSTSLVACGGAQGTETTTTEPPTTDPTDPEGDTPPRPTLGTPVGTTSADASAPPKDAGAEAGWAPTK